MYSSLNLNGNKRVIFPKGEQKRFLHDVKKISGEEWMILAEEVNVKSLKNYIFEKCTLPLEIFLCLVSYLEKHPFKVLSLYSGKITNKLSPKPFGLEPGYSKTQIKKVNITFNKNSLNLQVSKVKFSSFDKGKDIKLPPKITPLLAEEIGMHLGDGFLSDNRNEFRLKGDKKLERSYYNKHVKKLYKKLFNVDVNIKDYKDTIGFELSSQAIKEFKTKVLKIKPGRKDNLCLPDILRVNNEVILTSFLRGLFDTDGSVSFYSRSSYKKYYPCITISQKSAQLIKEVAEILKMLGFNPRDYHGKECSSLALWGISQLKHFEEKIGWSNPKHLKKVQRWREMYMATVV